MAAKVKWVVAVKQPIARALWHPRNGPSLAGIDEFRDDHVPFALTRINLIAPAISATVHPKIETMEMKRMGFERCINPPPVDCIIFCICKALCIRPGATIDNGHFAADKGVASVAVPKDVYPNAYDENFFFWIERRSRRIHH